MYLSPRRNGEQLEVELSGSWRGRDLPAIDAEIEALSLAGVDTLSIDPGVSETFDTHLALTGADRYGVENLANLDKIPRTGATIVVGLIPYKEGSGGQARVFATW